MPTDDFLEIYETHYRRLVVTAMILGADLATAEDAVQNAFTDLMKRDAETIRNKLAWLRTAVRHSVLQQWRLDQRRSSLSIDQLPETVSKDLTSEDPFQEDSRGQILELLKILPPRQRTIMALMLDGMTTRDISNELGISIEAVRSSLRYARAKLKDQLQAQYAAERLSDTPASATR